MPIPTESLPPNVLNALRSGNAIEAIKLLRTSSGIGLREAKDIVDQLAKANQASGAKAMSQGPKGAVEHPRHAGMAHSVAIPAKRSKLSPGEVPRSSGSAVGWIIVMALGAIAFSYLLR